MALKQRVLASWRLPPTDPRLGQMNIARWVVAHEMLLDRERWSMRQWARLFGVDLDVIRPGKEAKDNPGLFGVAPRIFPLAGLLNPDVYSKFVEQESSAVLSDGIPEDVYAEQIRQLEEMDMISDIDVISSEAETLAKNKTANERLSTPESKRNTP